MNHLNNDVLELLENCKVFIATADVVHRWNRQYHSTNTAMEGHDDILNLLVKNGSDTDHQNHEGRTALMEAVIYGRLYSVQFLLSKHANRSLTDMHGDDALKPNRNSHHYSEI